MQPWKIAAAAFILTGAINAQTTKGPGANPPPTPGNTVPRSTQPNNGNTTTPFPGGNNPYQPPIFISGTVMLSDGTPLPDRAKIEELWAVPAKVWWSTPDNPHLRLIKVTPEQAEYWDVPGNVMSSLKIAFTLATGKRLGYGDHKKVAL